MGRVCRTCSRVNPPEAFYCYYDGVVLDGHARNGGPIAVGAQAFMTPFVFPSGRTCRNFDEMVQACDTEWKVAQNLLKNDFFEGFFRNMGRADLALAARQCARSGDHDRGLDEFLGKLPCSHRDPAKLFAQPLEVNLGQLPRDRDHRFVLYLENQGSGLLYGTVLCQDTNWLAIGDGSAASPQKIFQCRLDATLPINVVAKNLRAGAKPLAGRLTIMSNGGTATVLVRVDVPVRPFPDGVLAGTISPRQVAERAKVSPKEAAPYFESGAVARWYESNGWIYPVQGPSASGLGAVQQFFEALGLTAAPRVEISEQRIRLRGSPGTSLHHTLHLQAVEKRPVFAHATTSATWVHIGKIHLGGQKAKIPVQIPLVPDQPGERLDAKIFVNANGNQRFVVDLSLDVEGTQPGRSYVGSGVPVLDMADVLAPTPIVAMRAPAPLEIHSGAREIPPVRMQISSDPSHVSNHVPLLQAVQLKEEQSAVASGQGVRRIPPYTATPSPMAVPEIAPAAILPTGAPVLGSLVALMLPLALIGLALLVTLVHDLLVRPDVIENGQGVSQVDPNPYIAVQFHDGVKSDNKMPEPSMRFGLVMTREQDPKDIKRPKRLTFDDWGRTNNTVVRVDDSDVIFGAPLRDQLQCLWKDRTESLGKDATGRDRSGLRSTMEIVPKPNGDARRPGDKKNIQVAQTVEIVPGEQSHALDTCLISYRLENHDNQPHNVGIRFMLDTFIGAEDGVPFTIPGSRDLCETMQRFNSPSEVPDYIEALEKADLNNPGTVARLQFRLGSSYESPTRVHLCGWPDIALERFSHRDAKEEQTLWQVPFVPMGFLHDSGVKRKDGSIPPRDSCVVVYWDPKVLQPGETRTVGFTYGLGNVANNESGGKLLLTLGGRLVRDGDLTLTALVSNPDRGEKLSLELPSGLRLQEGENDQEVPPPPPGAARKTSPVTWKLRASAEGTWSLTVRSSKGATQTLKVTIRSKGVFD